VDGRPGCVTIVLTGVDTATSSHQYADVYFDQDKQHRFVFLTNNFTLPALTVARLYKARWRVELFFKWIKQHLRIQAFYGTSQNAVKTQIWIAIAVYVLIAIIKKQLKLPASLYTILQVLSVTILQKTPILQALSVSDDANADSQDRNQLYLFEL
jgi:IS4 transposase